MITGFGNNVVSSLAADITANQTTIQVMPGTGAAFAGLLSYDYMNSSNTLKTYAKITLTDAKETVFEVCHLTSVSGDMLTVVRGQEGTTAKGWSLNDVIANFATRGSENQFVQIEQLQSGHYTAGVAGGTANALTLELPASYFVNGSADWTLRTPIVVYPALNNTGAATLQLTMGGRVLGTFKLYKGNKAELVANDILKDVALVCLMDRTKAFFNVANPGAIYAGLGTAAFKDIVTSMTDETAGRIPVVGWMGLGSVAPRTAVVASNNYDNIPKGLPSGFWTHAVSGGPYAVSFTLLQDGGGVKNNRHLIIPMSANDKIAVRFDGTPAADSVSYQYFYTDKNPPSASDTGAMPLIKTNLSVDLNTLGAQSNAGIYQQQANANATAANHYPVNQAGSLFVTPSAYGCQQLYITYSSRVFVRALNGNFTGSGPWTDWLELFSTNGGTLAGNLTIAKSVPTMFLKSLDDDTRQYIMAQKKDGAGSSWYVGKANPGSESLMLWNYVSNSGIEIDVNGRILLKRNGKDIIFQPDGTISGEIIGSNANNFRITYGNYGTFWRNDGGNLYLMLTNSGDPQGSYNSLRPFFVNLATGYITMGRLGLTDYTNFDARYQLINTASRATNGWFKDTNTGMITQWGTMGSTGNSSFGITFPTAFPNVCLNLSATRISTSDSPTVSVNSVSRTGATIKQADGGNGGSYWVAIGY